MRILTKFILWLNFNQVGEDRFGNKYYESRKINPHTGKKTRNIFYKGLEETSKVPANWHSWLHYTSDEIPQEQLKYRWQREYLPNLTGTKYAYRPAGHLLNGGVRGRVISDYQAWRQE